jgi:hypothetical protein
MGDNRWIRLYKATLDLRVEVRRLLSVEGKQPEWEVRLNREEVDRRIRRFAELHVREMLDEDPDLFYNDFLSVYAIREFATQASLHRQRKQKLGVGAAKTPNLSLVEEQLSGLRFKLDRYLDGLKPYWQAYEELGKPEAIAPHKAEIAAFLVAADEIHARLKGLSGIKALAEELEYVQDVWLTLSNEAQWLQHVAESAEGCRCI